MWRIRYKSTNQNYEGNLGYHILPWLSFDTQSFLMMMRLLFCTNEHNSSVILNRLKASIYWVCGKKITSMTLQNDWIKHFKKKKKAIMHKNRKDSKYVPAFWQVWYTRIKENEVRMVKAGVNIIIHDRRVTPTSMTRCSCTINGFPIVTKTYILSP